MNWTSAGDLGDIVVAMCVAKHAAKESTLLLRDDGKTKGIVRRYDVIAPLVKSQSYIKDCRVWDGEPIDWASEHFRKGYHSASQSLMSAHARHALAVGVIQTMPNAAGPWIDVKPNNAAKGRVVVNRSARYNNPTFPWAEIVKHYGDAILFVGLPDEHRMFCNAYGEVEFCPTENMLDVAQLIRACRLFIGNQSSAMTLAEAMKICRIQETSTGVPDCIYPEAVNAQYVATGYVELPKVGDKPETVIGTHPLRVEIQKVIGRELPRGGWLVKHNGNTLSDATYERTAKLLQNKASIPYEQAVSEVLRQNFERDPGFFKRKVRLEHLQLVANALRNAGYDDHPVIHAMNGRIEFTIP